MSIVVGRAPARVSLAGGGTDLPAWYTRHGGAVVSFTIGLFAYGQASPRQSDLELLSLDAGSREVVHSGQFERRMRPPILAEDFLLFQKAVAWHFGIERGRIAASSEIPNGAGLGSSGALCVALVQAASAFVGEMMDRNAVAETAASIEMDVLRRSCGKQDQYASAFGGYNLIEFFRDGSVDVTPLKITPEIEEVLQNRILLFGNGARRSAVGPLQEQARRSESDPDTVRALGRIKDLAFEMREVIEGGDFDRVGELLHEGWLAKQHLNSTVSAPEVARLYALAREAGASGGKLAGAGMSGTLVLYCPEETQDEVRGVMASQGWRERRADLDREGAALLEDGAVKG